MRTEAERIANLERRIDDVERRIGIKAEPVPPPLVFASLIPVGPPPPPPSNQVASAEETEYLVGTKFLPWAGVAFVVFAFVQFLIWGFRQGFITHGLIFGTEVAISLYFTVLGIWRRREQEDLGHLLTGIGAIGMYLCLTAGHSYHQVLSDQGLVTLFAVWSLGILSYGNVVRSPIFFWLGTLGGYLSASLPLLQSPEISIALFLLTFATANGSLLRLRWFEHAASHWLPSLFLLLFILEKLQLPAVQSVNFLLAAATVSLTVFLATYREVSGLRTRPLLGSLSLVTTLLFSVFSTHPLAFAAFPAIMVLSAFMLPKGKDLGVLEYGVGIAAFTVPLGLDQAAPPTYAAEALVGAVLCRRGLSKVVSVSLGLLAILGIGVALLTKPLPAGFEVITLLLLVATSVVITLQETSFRHEAEAVSALFTVGVIVRISYLWIAPQGSVNELTTLFSATLSSGVILSAFSIKSVRSGIGTAAFISKMIAALLCFVLLSSLSGNVSLANVTYTVVPPLLLGLLFGTWSAHRALEQDVLTGVLTVIGMPFAMRLGVALLRDDHAGGSIGLATYGLLCLLVGFGLRARSVRYCGLGFLAITALKVMLVDLAEAETIVRVAAAFLLGLAMLIGAFAYVRRRESL